MQLGVGAGAPSVAEKAHPSALLSPGVAMAGLPTGGISGPLAPHGMPINPPGQQQQQASPLGAPGGGSAGGASASWGRGAFARAGVVGAGAAPRRQRHKVSSKDLTEEQRIERRLVPAFAIYIFSLGRFCLGDEGVRRRFVFVFFPSRGWEGRLGK